MRKEKKNKLTEPFHTSKTYVRICCSFKPSAALYCCAKRVRLLSMPFKYSSAHILTFWKKKKRVVWNIYKFMVFWRENFVIDSANDTIHIEMHSRSVCLTVCFILSTTKMLMLQSHKFERRKILFHRHRKDKQEFQNETNKSFISRLWISTHRSQCQWSYFFLPPFSFMLFTNIIFVFFFRSLDFVFPFSFGKRIHIAVDAVKWFIYDATHPQFI